MKGEVPASAILLIHIDDPVTLGHLPRGGADKINAAPYGISHLVCFISLISADKKTVFLGIDDISYQIIKMSASSMGAGLNVHQLRDFAVCPFFNSTNPSIFPVLSKTASAI